MTVTGTVQEFFEETQISATSVEIVSSGNTPAHRGRDHLSPSPGRSRTAAGQLIRRPRGLRGHAGLGVAGPDGGRSLLLRPVSERSACRPSARSRPSRRTRPPDVDGFRGLSRHRRAQHHRDRRRANDPEPGGAALSPMAPSGRDDGLSSGDTVRDLVGVSALQLRKLSHQSNRGADPSSTPRRAPTRCRMFGGRLKVAAFIVLNYFNGDGAMAAAFPHRAAPIPPLRLQRQTDKLAWPRSWRSTPISWV